MYVHTTLTDRGNSCGCPPGPGSTTDSEGVLWLKGCSKGVSPNQAVNGLPTTGGTQAAGRPSARRVYLGFPVYIFCYVHICIIGFVPHHNGVACVGPLGDPDRAGNRINEGLADTYSAKRTSLLVFCSQHLCLTIVYDGMRGP